MCTRNHLHIDDTPTGYTRVLWMDGWINFARATALFSRSLLCRGFFSVAAQRARHVRALLLFLLAYAVILCHTVRLGMA